MINFIGWLAGFLTLLAGVPQILKLLTTKDRSGVNSWTYLFWCQTALWWCVWGALVSAVPTFVVNLACFFVLACTFFYLGPKKIQLFVFFLNCLLVFPVAIFSTSLTLLAASFYLLVLALPSVKTVFFSKDGLSGVSLLTWYLLVFNNILWLTFDIGIYQPFAGVAGTITAIFGVLVIVKVRRVKTLAQSFCDVPQCSP